MKYAYPRHRSLILKWLKEDQARLTALGKKLNGLYDLDSKIQAIKPVAKACQLRAVEVLDLLNEIHEPIKTNIGLDGSEAIIILTLHSNVTYMEKVLHIYEECIEKDPSSIASDSVASLVDRVGLIKTGSQKLGTIWLEDENGSSFIPPIQEIESVNKRRIRYRLGPIVNRVTGDNTIEAIKKLQKPVPQDIYDLNFVFMNMEL